MPKNGASKRPTSSLRKWAPLALNCSENQSYPGLRGNPSYATALGRIGMKVGLSVKSIFWYFRPRRPSLTAHAPEFSCVSSFPREASCKTNYCNRLWAIHLETISCAVHDRHAGKWCNLEEFTRSYCPGIWDKGSKISRFNCEWKDTMEDVAAMPFIYVAQLSKILVQITSGRAIWFLDRLGFARCGLIWSNSIQDHHEYIKDSALDSRYLLACQLLVLWLSVARKIRRVIKIQWHTRISDW